MSYELDTPANRNEQIKVPYGVSLLAGGAAGLAVDVSLFPLDTLKTRLQSSDGFWKSGGFRNVYSGILPAAMGSFPTAALFFLSYNASKNILQSQTDSRWAPVCHAVSTCIGEVAACTTRVPVEVVKQRLQAERSAVMSKVIRDAVREEGFFGLYRGWGSTIIREIPFSALQFPLWESMKNLYRQRVGRPLYPVEGAACGAIAGGLSAALTTPLDVGKTRIMLFKVEAASNQLNVVPSLKTTLALVYREQGLNGLFAGVVPRTLWITVGGFVFFGVYEFTADLLSPTIR